MADNLSQKSNKSNEKTKYSNVINRTTSETMRLGEPEKVVNHPTSLISSTPTQRKKTPSFQITSVTVGSRTSNDGGDDSADDLDESHTDDMSDVIDNSRITDIENETPSYSEDTFSKEDVFFNASTTSLGTAPVIPTSSQYGLAIVASEGGNNILNAAVACANTISGGDVHVSVTDAGNVINIVGSVKPHETEMRDGHAHHAGRNERFKVVKIESTEPFKRGRWLCMDYLDHTMQQPSQQAVINVVRSNDSSDATTVGSVQYVGPPDSGVVITDGPMTLQSMDEQIITVDQSQLKVTAVSMQEQHQAMVAAQHQIAMASLTTGQSTTAPTNFHSISPGQTLQTGPVQQHITSQSHQSMQQAPASVQQSMQQTNIPQSLPQNIQQVVSQQQLQQQSQQANQQQNLQGLSQHAQSMSQVSIQQNMTAGPPQQPAAVAQHQSLPPQQIQQVMAAANLQQMQQQQQQIQQQMTQHQAFVPQASAQQAQSQHITSQPGQSQGQYYNIPSSTVSQQVPISQGQSTIQIQTQTSISAQTQTSTPSQQVVTNVPLSHHQIQQGGVSQQIGQPASQPQQHSIQLQQQQYAQQIQTQAQQQIQQPQQAMSQSAMQPQVMSQQSMQQAQSMTQQTLQQAQAMQQQQGLSLQQPQQTMSQQTLPQQTMSQQALPQQTISQQAMSQAIQQTQQSVAQQSMSQPSISQQAMSQVMSQPQQAIPQVIQQSQQSMPQVLQNSQQSIQQQVIQQPQQVIQQPQQVIQQPQQVIQQPQQVIQQPQQVIQQPQQVIQQPQQVIQQPQQVIQQPQQIIQQPQQVIQQPQQQVIQQPQQQVIQQPQQQVIQQPQQQVIQQPQQQVIQQPQQQVIQQPQQQVIQQPQQQVIQPPQQPPQSIPQAMQPQQVLQQPQTIQTQIHHPTNLQNLPPQQIHIGTVPNIAPQSQHIPQSSLGQGMLPGHHGTVTGGQGPQMVQVSSVVSSVSQSFPHMSVSQATIVSSRTVQSSVGLDGTVDQTNLSDPSTTLLESLKEVATSAEEVQPSGVTAGEDAESFTGLARALATSSRHICRPRGASSSDDISTSPSTAVPVVMGLSRTTSPVPSGGDGEKHSASGTSAVAIDNKIEQAMDLVKSHLMFAVREEVEVLKEKIAELMDRINQLEVENTILKAHATQETLAQLGGNATQQGNKNQQTQQPPNGSVS